MASVVPLTDRTTRPRAPSSQTRNVINDPGAVRAVAVEQMQLLGILEPARLLDDMSPVVPV